MRQRQRATRERSKGVAVLELTLSLVFLVPLMMATLDFGYYFYVGANAQEAARQGVLQAVGIAGGCPGLPAVETNCNAAVANICPIHGFPSFSPTARTSPCAGAYIDI